MYPLTIDRNKMFEREKRQDGRIISSVVARTTLVLLAVTPIILATRFYVSVRETYGFAEEVKKDVYQNRHSLELQHRTKSYSDAIESRPSSQQDALSSCTPPPLIIGAGQGTTGTHTLHFATCSLGFLSVHWRIKCLKDSNETFHNLTKYFESNNYCLPGKTQKSGKHFLLIEKMESTLKCLRARTRYAKTRNCEDRAFTDAAQWARTVKKEIDALTKWEPATGMTIGAIHDVPYPMFLPYTIESATRNRGKSPIILISDRNPLNWTYRRNTKHDIFLCLLDLNHTDSGIYSDGGGDDESIPNFSDLDVDDAIQTSHFDWLSCIERTIQAMTIKQNDTAANSNIKVPLDKVFTSLRNVLNGWNTPNDKVVFPDALISHTAYSFAKHQKYWKARADYTVNMFEQPNVTVESVATKVHDVLWNKSIGA
jgi:hypothetical protein